MFWVFCSLINNLCPIEGEDYKITIEIDLPLSEDKSIVVYDGYTPEGVDLSELFIPVLSCVLFKQLNF